MHTGNPKFPLLFLPWKLLIHIRWALLPVFDVSSYVNSSFAGLACCHHVMITAFTIHNVSLGSMLLLLFAVGVYGAWRL